MLFCLVSVSASDDRWCSWWCGCDWVGGVVVVCVVVGGVVVVVVVVVVVFMVLAVLVFVVAVSVVCVCSRGVSVVVGVVCWACVMFACQSSYDLVQSRRQGLHSRTRATCRAPSHKAARSLNPHPRH